MEVSYITLVKPISISLSLVVEEFKVAECLLMAECRLMAPKENQKMTWQPEQGSTYACK